MEDYSGDYNQGIKAMVSKEGIEKRINQAESAPLFVKVDKYRELLSSIYEIKVFVSGVKQSFTVLTELEEVRKDAINVMRATVQRLEKAIIEIDSELLRPRGVDMSDLMGQDNDIKYIEESLEGLQDQIRNIKKEMKQIG